MSRCVLLLLAAGCSSAPAVPTDLQSVMPGVYEGTLHFDAKGKLGPIAVVHDFCDADASVTVEPTMVIVGSAACTLQDFGALTIAFDGSVSTLPYADGNLEADPVVGTWSGWFTASDALYAVSKGTMPEAGYTVAYTAQLDVDLVTPQHTM